VTADRYIPPSERDWLGLRLWDPWWGPMPNENPEPGRILVGQKWSTYSPAQLAELGLWPEASGYLPALLAEKAWYDAHPGVERPVPRIDARIIYRTAPWSTRLGKAIRTGEVSIEQFAGLADVMTDEPTSPGEVALSPEQLRRLGSARYAFKLRESDIDAVVVGVPSSVMRDLHHFILVYCAHPNERWW
jgi:hypothetical protein